MFLPVTMIEDLPHLLLYFNFSLKNDRYFLSPHQIEISKDGSQKTVCQIIRSSDFLCGLLNIDRAMISQQNTSETSSESNDPLIAMIEGKLDFKHRCMFYSTGPTSDLCGKEKIDEE